MEYANQQKVVDVKEGDELEFQAIIDTINHHYQVTCIGWQSLRRVFFPIFHLDIKEGKIWVQEATSEFDIVGHLENCGIPKDDIVLAFHAPYKRKYTGYAA